MAHDYCMSREFMKMLAPDVLDRPRAMERILDRLVGYSRALLDYEIERRRARHQVGAILPMNRLTLNATSRVTALAAVAGVALLLVGCGDDAARQAKSEAKATAARPALTVALAVPQQANWPQTLAANGNVMAWQEAIIGAELSGLRVTEVLVNVGDSVKRGQPLARIAAESVLADLAQARASVAEAEAALAEAKANAERSKQLQSQGFISSQATIQVLTAEQTTAARLAAARARVQAEEVRLAQARIVAPDDGVISARTATVGSLTAPNQEMFRLIRGGRLEWRAEVTGSELQKITPGMRAVLTTASGTRIDGAVRAVAPAVDPAHAQRHRLRRPATGKRGARRHFRTRRIRTRQRQRLDAAAERRGAA